jgi:hypothetical protein
VLRDWRHRGCSACAPASPAQLTQAPAAPRPAPVSRRPRNSQPNRRPRAEALAPERAVRGGERGRAKTAHFTCPTRGHLEAQPVAVREPGENRTERRVVCLHPDREALLVWTKAKN